MAEEMVVSVPLMEFLENEVKDRVAQKEWMKNRTFKRAENMEEVMVYVDEAIAAGRCALDLETTGLSTRVRYVEGEKVPVNKIIGFCLCYDSSFGIYIPINHVESDGIQDKPSQYNLPEEHVFPEMQRLCSNCITIYHNAKFDIAFLNNHGITIGNHKDYDDTMLLAYMFDSGQKDIGLKNLSARMLNQPMLELTDMTGDKKSHRLELICPTVAYIYGASDAICTLDLYNYLIERDIVKAQSVVYALEKRVVIVLIEMEGNLVKIDKPYLEEMQKKGEERLESIIKEIYELAGKEFNIGSPIQLGKILFEDLGYTYPVNTKTASGQYLTNNITLEKIADQYPVVNKIVRFRKLSKMLGTYINNLLINCDEEDCVKLNFKQTGTDTGRFSSPGGRGLLVDGLAGVNVQAIPKMPPKDNADMNLRDAFVARPGTTMVAIDYANEEMRVATNLAHETTWINAIRDGVDFHTATAAIIAGKEPKDVLKAERKIGKTVNFLALYLGGPMTLSAQAKVTVPEAKKILATYFAGVPHLRKWIDTEIIKARKRKFVKTVFGRTRLLNRFYGSGDRGLESHGDRCAINTQIQGTSADIMKAVMSKLYHWIHRNNLQDEIKTLITMHDELVFEIPTEKLELYVPEIAKIMMLKEVITDRLKWTVPLTVDVQYGRTWRTGKDFFADFPGTEARLNEPLMEFAPQEKKAESVSKEESTEQEEKPEEKVTIETPSVETAPQDIETEEKDKKKVQEESPPEVLSEGSILQNTIPSLSMESEGVFIYELKDRRKVTLRWLNDILNYLIEESAQISENNKQTLKIKDHEGNSLLISEFKLNIESFQVLVKFFGI